MQLTSISKLTLIIFIVFSLGLVVLNTKPLTVKSICSINNKTAGLEPYIRVVGIITDVYVRKNFVLLKINDGCSIDAVMFNCNASCITKVKQGKTKVVDVVGKLKLDKKPILIISRLNLLS